MAKIIDVNFWTLLIGINKALENKDLELCLSLLEMITMVDDAKNLDELPILNEFQIVLLIREAGEIGYDIWKQVVSETGSRINYSEFLQSEVDSKFGKFKIIINSGSIKIKEENWIEWKPSFNIQKDLVRIELMWNVYLTNKWSLTDNDIKELIEFFEVSINPEATIVKKAIKDESDRIFDDLE